METITVTAHFHTAHRQLGFPGHCRHVHGHTWRGKITVRCEKFPRDAIEVSLDFGALKRIMRDLDHKILVAESDRTFFDSEHFDPEGIVVIPGKGPSVEAVAEYVSNGVQSLITKSYPGQGKRYDIAVQIQETDNNFFLSEKTVEI